MRPRCAVLEQEKRCLPRGVNGQMILQFALIEFFASFHAPGVLAVEQTALNVHCKNVHFRLSNSPYMSVLFRFRLTSLAFSRLRGDVRLLVQ